MSEFITLSSKDSLEFFPGNSMTNFRVKLAKRLELGSEWEVACVRFSFTHSLCNFNRMAEVYIVDHRSNKRLATVHLAPQRLNNIGHLVGMIMKLIWTEVVVSKQDRMPQVAVSEQRRVYTTTGMIGGRPVRLEFSDNLNLLLGIERNGFYFIDAYKTDIYVYADCVNQRVVGDVNAPLLTTIDIGNETMIPGQQKIIKIKKPEYIPISHSEIDEIEIQCLDDTGLEPKFDFGSLALTLHFRKR